MTLPNFFVIGAGRSGTTSLQRYLSQHPEIYMAPVKAPSHFFCRDLARVADPRLRLVTRTYFVPDRRDYEALFDGVSGEKAIGEVSPVYLADRRVAGRIAAECPAARLIALVRNPVERVHARYVARSRDGLERRALERIVREERALGLERECAFGTYLPSAACHRFLESYFERFPREQIRVHLFDDFARSPQAVMRDLFEFLAVDPSFEPDTSVRHNESRGVIGHPLLRFLWTRSAPARVVVRPFLPERLRDAVFSRFTRHTVPAALEPDLRRTLQDLFRHDIDSLQTLIGRDLSGWLTTAAPR